MNLKAWKPFYRFKIQDIKLQSQVLLENTCNCSEFSLLIRDWEKSWLASVEQDVPREYHSKGRAQVVLILGGGKGIIFWWTLNELLQVERGKRKSQPATKAESCLGLWYLMSKAVTKKVTCIVLHRNSNLYFPMQQYM